MSRFVPSNHGPLCDCCFTYASTGQGGPCQRGQQSQGSPSAVSEHMVKATDIFLLWLNGQVLMETLKATFSV